MNQGFSTAMKSSFQEAVFPNAEGYAARGWPHTRFNIV
jgi:hypothetical protein